MPTESTFWLAGFLILAAGLGWAFEHFTREREDQRPDKITADYIRGLNLVLNRKTDEALELFVKMAKVDDETLETHFALGHLFRRRGEVDRAIRVHQNLLARPSLNEAQRHQARFALAEDYFGAGLFDRAEQLFAELAASRTQGQAALERLVDIYEREREWDKAIETYRQLERETGEPKGRIPQYFCELAERARIAGDPKGAAAYLDEADREGAGGLRGSFTRALIAKGQGRYEQAIALYERVLAADRRFMAELLPELVACYRALGRRPEFDDYVDGLVQNDPSLRKDLAYAAIVGDLAESPALRRCIEGFVESNEVLMDLVNIDDFRTASPEIRERTIKRVVRGLRQLAMKSVRYRCTNCGYGTQKLIWHCPSCKQWETVRPVQTFQFDALGA